MTEKNFLTTKELAERWKFSEHTLAVWRFRGKGPNFHKKGYKKVVYFLEDIKNFEKENPGFTH